MEIDELLLLNKQGLIPGPYESEAEFAKRAHYCLNLTHEKNLFFPEEARGPCSILKEAWPLTEALYDQKAEWIPIFFSNYKLAPWHGGCAWIFQHDADSPTSAFFQLRKNFRVSDVYFCLYKRSELIAHELAHVGRMEFEEPKFEEILAYRTSPGWLRRLFGPIVQSSKESAWFMYVLIPLLLLDIYLILDGDFFLLWMAGWAKLILVGMILAALGRLWVRQSQFHRALHHLQELHSGFADAILYRLTDEEIISFSRMKPEDIVAFAQDQKEQSVRWKLIWEAYFVQMTKRCNQ